MEVQIDNADCPNFTLVLQKHELAIQAIEQQSSAWNVEQEACIQTISERVYSMGTDLTNLKEDVRSELKDMREDMTRSISEIRDEIPLLFENSINKLLAKVFKWFLGIIAIIIITGVFLFTKPLILKGIENIKTWVEKTEEIK